MKTKSKLAILALTSGIGLLTACAQQRTRGDREAEAPAPSPRSAPIAPTAPEAAPAPPAASAPASPAPDRQEAPIVSGVDIQFTGIQACDEYLASYKACHSVIGSYAPDQIDERLAMLRATWLEKARDPEQREALEAQCNSVAETMKEALNGRECKLPESDFVEADE